MAKNLPLNAKDFYEGKNPFIEVEKGAKTLLTTIDDMQKKLIAVNQELGKSMKSNVKETSTDYQKLNTELTKSQQNTEALNKINEEKARLEASLLKLNKQSQQENEELNILIQNQKKANKELAREQLGLVKAYEKLTKQTNEAQKKFKNLAAEFGVNSKQAKAAKVEFDKLDNQLRKVNDAAKDGRRDVGRYAIGWQGVKTSLMNTIGALGITGGIAGALSVVKGALESTESTADKFKETISGVQGALGFMARALANMDFSNLIQGMRDAYAEGIRYEKGLDLSEDLKRSVEIQMKIIDGEQSTLKAVAKNKKLELDVREKAITDFVNLEEERLKITKQYTKQRLENELKNAEDITNADRETILELISNRGKYVDKLEEGAAIQKKIFDETTKVEQIQAGESVTTSIIVDEEKRLELLSQLTDEQRNLIKLSNLDKQLVGEKRDLIAAALKENLDADNALKFSKESLIKLENSLYNELIKEQESNNVNANSLAGLRVKLSELQKEKEKLLATDIEGIFTKQQEIELLEKQIKTLDTLGKTLEDPGEIELLEKQIKIQGVNKINVTQETFTKDEPESNPFIDQYLADADAKLQIFAQTNKAELDAEKARIEALKNINEGGYSSIFDIFSKWATKKKAKDEELSADEIEKLNDTNQAKVQAVEELVNTLISIYTELLDSRIQDLETEINATNQKINETEQALNRETSLQEQGAANNVAIEKQKLERLQQERDKDLQEQKKLQKERDKVNKLTQISSLITAIANIIAQYSDMGPVGWVLGLLAASAAVVGYISASGEAESAVGEEGELLTKKGTYLESGKRHSRGGNKYSSAEFEEGEAHAIFSRDATRRNYKDIKQFTDLVNSGKWDLYKSQIGGNLNSIIVNNDYEKLLAEQRKTNQILQSQIRPVYNNKGKLVKFNINGVMIKAEI